MGIRLLLGAARGEGKGNIVLNFDVRRESKMKLKKNENVAKDPGFTRKLVSNKSEEKRTTEIEVVVSTVFFLH